MAGNYLLKTISHTDIAIALSKGGVLSGLAHQAGAGHAGAAPFTGWNAATRACLEQLSTGGMNAAYVNRDLLPPHRYLQFGPLLAGNAADDITLNYLRAASWVDALTRPNMGLAGLNAGALAAWPANKTGSLLAQVVVPTSIEIYTTTGLEMA